MRGGMAAHQVARKIHYQLCNVSDTEIH